MLAFVAGIVGRGVRLYQAMNVFTASAVSNPSSKSGEAAKLTYWVTAYC